MFVFRRNIIREWWQQQQIQHNDANFINNSANDSDKHNSASYREEKRKRRRKKYKIKSSEKAEEKWGPLSLSTTIEKYSYYHLPMILRYIPPSSTSFFETTARSFFIFLQLYTLILENITWIPPTPMTNSNWLINNDASRLSRVVPANDLRSLNRL